MRIQFDHLKQSVLGWYCPYCKITKIFIEGAVAHEMEIDENGGECPDAENSEEQ
jgi:hypothetical protein